MDREPRPDRQPQAWPALIGKQVPSRRVARHLSGAKIKDSRCVSRHSTRRRPSPASTRVRWSLWRWRGEACLVATGSQALTAAGSSAATEAGRPSSGTRTAIVAGCLGSPGSFVGLAGPDEDGRRDGRRAMLQPITDFDGWRGRPSDVALQYIGRRYFTKDYPAFSEGAGAPTTPALRVAGFTPILSIPLVNKADAGRFADVATAASMLTIRRSPIACADHGAGQDLSSPGLGKRQGLSMVDHCAQRRGPAGSSQSGRLPQCLAAVLRGSIETTVPGAVMVWNTLKHPPVNGRSTIPATTSSNHQHRSV